MTHEDRRMQELERSHQRQDKRAHLRYLEDEYYDDLLEEPEAMGIAQLMADAGNEEQDPVVDVPPSRVAPARSPLAEALRVVRRNADDERTE